MAIRMNKEEAGCFLLVMGIGAVLFGLFFLWFIAFEFKGEKDYSTPLYIIGGGILAIWVYFWKNR
jgi:hypothetical protein|tara:strand:- start:134 stop:328 length:195 start_codon:yes stop_codon:yes gene_type:complete